MGGQVLLSNRLGDLTLNAAGGMIGPFRVAHDGSPRFDVLTVTDWRDRPGADKWLPLIRNLSGDFICLPYGATKPNPELPEAWRAGAKNGAIVDPMFHGIPPNVDWVIEPNAGGTAAMLWLDLPEPHPLARLERQVALSDDGRSYTVTLSVMARADCRLPLSLHPCFRLPGTPAALELSVEQSGPGWTYPIPPVPERQGVEANTTFETLSKVNAPGAGWTDLTRLPPQERCEVLVQLPVTKGLVTLDYPREDYRVQFEWNKTVLPSLVLWVSNLGRDEAPFSGQFRTLGVEAVAGVFDLGPHVSASPETPIAKSGLATGVAFEAGQKFETTYRVSVSELSGRA